MSCTLLNNSNTYNGVKQFTIFIDQQTFSLNFLLKLIFSNKLTLIAFSSNETSEYLILRLVTNYPDKFKTILIKNKIHFCEHDVLAAEFRHPDDISKIIDAIFSAEIKVHYIYPILSTYNNKIGIILGIEDINLASKAISQVGISILSQDEINR